MKTRWRGISSAELSVAAVRGGANQEASVGENRRSILGSLHVGSNRNFETRLSRSNKDALPEIVRGSNGIDGRAAGLGRVSRRQWLATLVTAAHAGGVHVKREFSRAPILRWLGRCIPALSGVNALDVKTVSG